MEQYAHHHLFSEKRMRNLFLLSLLIRNKDLLSCVVAHDYRSRIHLLEPFILNLLEIYQGKGEAIANERPELLHKIEGKSGATRSIPVQKTDRGIKPDRLQSRPDVVHDEGVNEREEAVYVVERRSPVSLVKAERVLLGNDQVIEYIEIDTSRIPLYASEFLEGVFLIDDIELPGEAGHGMAHLLFINLCCMVPERPLQYSPAIGDFSRKNGFCDLARRGKIVSSAVLLPSEQYVPRHRPLDPGQKAPVFGQKAHSHLVLSAESHKIWAAPDVTETDDPTDGVDGKPKPHIAIYFDSDRLALLRQIGSLGGDVQGIEMLFHGASAWIIFFRYRFTDILFSIFFGRHSPTREQLLHRFP